MLLKAKLLKVTMSQSTTHDSAPTLAASKRQLVTAVLLTLIGAALILVTIVLPAEYQIDPTGIGSALGLTQIHDTPADAAVPDLPPAAEGDVVASSEPARRETATLEIGPNEQIEFKISMAEGRSVLYSWTAEGGVLFEDFHAEPFNDLENADLRYEEREAVASGYGSLRAPYSGRHGWYWRNDGTAPVVVTLEVVGYFTSMEEIFRAPVE
jgi:hypothetical protein